MSPRESIWYTFKVSSIYDFVRKQRDDYRSKTITIAEGYDFSQYETLRTIELYDNSRFLSGNKDALDREKPFYNIGRFRRNVATRATDLDSRDTRVESDRATTKGYVASFLLNLKNRNWMKETRFGVFLNRMTQTRCKYGGVIVKKIEHDGELGLHVMQWLNMITDQVDIRNGVKIERHYYTPSDLKTNAPKGWTNIKEAIEAAKKSREAHAANKKADENETPGEYIEVYEVHGVLPTAYLRGTSENYGKDYGADDEYERQMHVVVLDESDKEKTEGVTLFAGMEDEDPYKYLPYEEVDGRGLGVGVIEDLFEAQVWTNDSVMKKKDMLEIAGKVIFQTSDKSIAAKNILTEIENGQIIEHAKDQPVSQLNNVPASLPAFDKLIDEWDKQAERVSSTFNAITGETMPSGTPFRQVAILNQEAGSMFEYRREEAGLFVNELYRDWVLPFLVKQLKADKELTATLEPEELELVSEAIANHEAFSFGKEQILGGNLVQPQDLDGVKQAARDISMKARRKTFKNFGDILDGWEGQVDVVTTGEQKNKSAALETLFNIFKIVATTPQILQDPVLARLFNQLVEAAGVSPLLLKPSNDKLPMAPAAPQSSTLPQSIETPAPTA